MKLNTIVRIAAVTGLIAVLLAWGAALSAADPTGDSPANGLPVGAAPFEICVSQTLAPGAQIWFKVPYHAGKDLEMYAKNASGVNFDVYDPDKVKNWPTLAPQPTGRLTPNKNEPDYTKSWQGHIAQGMVSDFYYVLVTNTTASPVTFSFCTRETEKFTPPPGPDCPPLGARTIHLDENVINQAPERASTAAFDGATDIQDDSGVSTTIGPDGCPALVPAEG